MITRNPKNVSGAKTRDQLAEEYKISRRTLYNWLNEAGICTKGKLLTPRDLILIYEKFGHPEGIVQESFFDKKEVL